MKLDLKKFITKTVPTLGLSLILLLTGTMAIGCGEAEPITKHNGQITVYEQKIENGYYYLVKENKLYQVKVSYSNVNLNPVMDLTDEQVIELEQYSVGEFVDHNKIDEELVLDHEFIFVKDGKMTIVNKRLNKDEEVNKEIQGEYKEDIENALNGFVIDLDKI